MTHVLDRRQTERAYRTTITTLSYAKGQVERLVDGDLAGSDLLTEIDSVIGALETDRDTYRDWLRE